jgi:hypothetical protein
MDRTDIILLIEQEVRADIHGDLYGQERVADAVVQYIEQLLWKIKQLEEEKPTDFVSF